MADNDYLSIEAVTDEVDLSSLNSQMAPVVTGGTIKADTATFTDWPMGGRTRTARYDATSSSGGCYSSVTPSSPTGGWERLLRIRYGAAPASTMTFWQLRNSGGIAMELRMTSGRVIQVVNAAGSVISSFAALATSGAYYIGIFSTPSSTVGQILIRIWSPTGTLIEEFTTSTANTGAAAFNAERVGSKINAGTFVWTLWVGVMEHNHTSETTLTLAPPLTDPIGASHVDDGWIFDDTTDATPGALTISGVSLSPSVLYIVDNANHRIAVQLSDVDIAYSYTVTNGTTGRTGVETGTIPASSGVEPSPAQEMVMIGGVLTEVL